MLLNTWNARFNHALQHKNAAAFGYELLIFAPLVAAFILLAVYQLYLSQALQIWWRQWMTDRLLGSWLQGSTPYRMQLSADGVDNPYERIAEDIKLFVSNTRSLRSGSPRCLRDARLVYGNPVGSLERRPTLPVWPDGAPHPRLFGLGRNPSYAVAGTSIAHLI